MYLGGMVGGLSQYFLVGFSLNFSVTIETGIAAVKGFHT